MLILSFFVLSFLDFQFVYVLLKIVFNRFIYKRAILLFRLVLFRRFNKQTRLVGSNKILIDSMSLNFIHGEKNTITFSRYV